MKTKQLGMFGAGEDLPLFSGVCQEEKTSQVESRNENPLLPEIQDVLPLEGVSHSETINETVSNKLSALRERTGKDILIAYSRNGRLCWLWDHTVDKLFGIRYSPKLSPIQMIEFLDKRLLESS